MGISRRRRAELARAGQLIRRRGQRAGWTVPEIVARIRRELPEVSALEAWRWAYGWSRPQTVQQVTGYYQDHDLGVPGLNCSMLCRYEHGEIAPGPAYAEAFAAVYQAAPGELGLASSNPSWAVNRGPGGYGAARGTAATARNGDLMANGSSGALQALRDSIALGLEAEGPAGGSGTLASLHAAVDYYGLHYSASPPSVLATEVHQVRHMVNEILAQGPPDNVRAELRQVAGWLSALVGNLAFHLDDRVAARVHLVTAQRLATVVGDRWLECWALGAQAMIANEEGHYRDAIALGGRAHELADTQLRKAQMLAWALLRPTAALGDRREATRIAGRAEDAMDSAQELPGRFGFDQAELTLHLAEAGLLAGDAGQARAYAQASIRAIPKGRPGWAAAMLILARGEAARGHQGDAATLGVQVLDTVAAERLRASTRNRLSALVDDVSPVAAPSVTELRERARALPALMPAARASEETNGH